MPQPCRATDSITLKFSGNPDVLTLYKIWFYTELWLIKPIIWR